MSCTAYLVNIDTNTMSAWLSVGFQRVWKLNGKMYGIKPDGVYLIEGDSTYPVAIEIAPTNFADSKTPVNDNMKRLPYCTIDGGGTLTVTPVFDRVAGTPQTSQFNGNTRVKFGRAGKGRFIGLKITSSDTAFKLESVRYFPQMLSRRV